MRKHKQSRSDINGDTDWVEQEPTETRTGQERHQQRHGQGGRGTKRDKGRTWETPTETQTW